MPRLPEWAAKPLKEGWGRNFNQSAQLDYPPGTTQFDLEPSLRDEYWLVYGWNYGQMQDSDGIQHFDSDFAFEWSQWEKGLSLFEDPMTASVMDSTYPMFLIVTQDRPAIITANNNTGETQTIDYTAFVVLFKSEAGFTKWSDWFDERYAPNFDIQVAPQQIQDIKQQIQEVR